MVVGKMVEDRAVEGHARKERLDRPVHGRRRVQELTRCRHAAQREDRRSALGSSSSSRTPQHARDDCAIAASPGRAPHLARPHRARDLRRLRDAEHRRDPGLRADRAAAFPVPHRLRARPSAARCSRWHALSGGWRNVPLDQEGHDAPDWIAFVIISAGVILHMVDHRLGGIHHRRDRCCSCWSRAGSAAGGSSATRSSRSCSPSVVFFIFTLGPGLEPAQGTVLGDLAMDTFSALMSGFAVALTLKNLMWGFLGVTLGTAIGVLPGVGPALTIALLLPATAGLEPDRRADHVRRHLLRRDVRRLDDVDPAQHARRVGDDRHRARRQHDGQARPRGARARDVRHRLFRRRNDRDDRCSP